MINTDRKTTLWHKTKNVYRPKIRFAACVLSKLQAHQKRVLNGVRPVYDKGIQRPWRSFQKRHPINFISSNFKSHRPLIYSVCLKRELGWIFWTRWYNLIYAVAQHFENIYNPKDNIDSNTTCTTIVKNLFKTLGTATFKIQWKFLMLLHHRQCSSWFKNQKRIEFPETNT